MPTITANSIDSLNPRDEMAIAALPLLVQKYEKVNISLADVAKRAYDYADAMLAESAARRNANQPAQQQS